MPVMEEEEMTTVSTRVLAEAFRLAYAAGRAESVKMEEALEFVEQHVTKLQRAIRKPKPTPISSIHWSLELVRLASRNARGLREPPLERELMPAAVRRPS